MNNDLVTTIRGKKAIFFDLFHTLVSVEPNQAIGPGTPDILGVTAEEWNHQLLECSEERLIGEMTDPHEIISSMARALNPEISDDIIAHAVIERRKRFTRALENVPLNTLNVLAELGERGKKLALISNADVLEAGAWETGPMAKHFNETLFSCHVGYAKPAHEIYQMGMERVGLSSNKCLFIGDGGSNELSGAQQCGITTVMMTGIIKELWPEKIDEQIPSADFVIKDLNELLG